MDSKIVKVIKEAAEEKREELTHCEKKLKTVRDTLAKLQQEEQGLRETLYTHANFLNQYAEDKIPGVACCDWEVHLGLCTKPDALEMEEEFCWFDTESNAILKIDDSNIGSDGSPVPPIDCIKVKKGTTISIFRSKDRGTKHIVIGGRAPACEAKYGLYSLSDFDEEHYSLEQSITVK
jgi:hypothetical protein